MMFVIILTIVIFIFTEQFYNTNSFNLFDVLLYLNISFLNSVLYFSFKTLTIIVYLFANYLLFYQLYSTLSNSKYIIYTRIML